MCFGKGGKVENIMRKGENAGYQHFLLFPQCFQKASVSSRQKSVLCGKELCQSSTQLFCVDSFFRMTIQLITTSSMITCCIKSSTRSVLLQFFLLYVDCQPLQDYKFCNIYLDCCGCLVSRHGFDSWQQQTKVCKGGPSDLDAKSLQKY